MQLEQYRAKLDCLNQSIKRLQQQLNTAKADLAAARAARQKPTDTAHKLIDPAKLLSVRNMLSHCQKQNAYLQQRVGELEAQSHQKGLDLSLHGYCPDVHPVTKHPIYAWEDEPHKLKNLMQGI